MKSNRLILAVPVLLVPVLAIPLLAQVAADLGHKSGSTFRS